MSHCIPHSLFGSGGRMEPHADGTGKKTSRSLSNAKRGLWLGTMKADELLRSFVFSSTLSSLGRRFHCRTTS